MFTKGFQRKYNIKKNIENFQNCIFWLDEDGIFSFRSMTSRTLYSAQNVTFQVFEIQQTKNFKIAFFDYMKMVSFHFGQWRLERSIQLKTWLFRFLKYNEPEISKNFKIVFFDYMKMVSFHFGQWRLERCIKQWRLERFIECKS